MCRDFSEEDIRQLYILACTDTSNDTENVTKEYLDFFTTLEVVMKVVNFLHSSLINTCIHISVALQRQIWFSPDELSRKNSNNVERKFSVQKHFF